MLTKNYKNKRVKNFKKLMRYKKTNKKLWSRISCRIYGMCTEKKREI